MFARRRFGAAAKREANAHFRRALRECAKWDVLPVRPYAAAGFQAAASLESWPIEKLEGSPGYRGITEHQVRNAVQAMTWWYVFSLRCAQNGGDGDDAGAIATTLVPLEDQLADVMVGDIDGRTATVDHQGLASIVNQVLIGRSPGPIDYPYMIAAHYLVATGLGHLSDDLRASA